MKSFVSPLFHDVLIKRPAAPIDSAAIFALDAPMCFLAEKIAPPTAGEGNCQPKR